MCIRDSFLNDDTHVGVNKLNIELIGEESDITLTFKNKVNDMLSDIMSAGSGEQVDSMIICSDICLLYTSRCV